MTVLSPRFEDKGESVIYLNDLQKQTRDRIKEKVASGVYQFRQIACPICGTIQDAGFEELSKTDRYGFYHPVKACRTCGLVQANPRMTEESYNEFYDSEYRLLYHGSEDYAEASFESQKKRAPAVYKHLKKSVDSGLQDADVLDVGCGSGGMLAYFRERGHRVAGCDLDKKAINYGRDNGLPLQEGSVGELSLDWEPDLVILSHVVEHFLTPVEDLKKIRGLLHADSVVYVEVPGIKQLSPFRSYYKADFLRQLQNAHTFYFSATSLGNIMSLSGFDPITLDEFIRGVFTPSRHDRSEPNFNSDYPAVFDHLEELEQWKRWGISPIPTTLHDAYTHPIVLSLLKRSGLYPYVRKVYHGLR